MARLIISASRRTDIPAFYGNWFWEKIKQNKVNFRNPFSGKISEVSLKLEDVGAIIFWTKNCIPFTKYLIALHNIGYNFYIHYTITGLSKKFEKQSPDTDVTVDNFIRLSDKFGPNRILWRYDPIIITEEMDSDYHKKTFYNIAKKLKGKTDSCYFSFVMMYNKVKNRFFKNGIKLPDVSAESKIKLACEISFIAGEFGITLYSCCGDFLVSGNIKKAHCIDGELINKLFPDADVQVKPNPTREQCGCTDSKDIGTYNSCKNKCVYCYANSR